MLLKVILFKHPQALRLLPSSPERLPLAMRVEYGNFIPLKTILYYLEGRQSTGVALRNLLGNIVAFVPMGFLLPVVLPRLRRIWQVVAASVGISLSLEVIQLLSGIGQFDVDDLLLNLSGAVIGWLLLAGARRTARSWTARGGLGL